jgi:hypothetical protein
MSENAKNVEKLNSVLPKKVDVVILHTYTLLADAIVELINKRGKTADVYYTGEKLLKNFEKYPKDTKFCFNYSLEGGLTGKDVAIRLHDAGYTNLYLYTGWQPDCVEEFDLPDYLQVVFNYGSDNPARGLVDILCE